MREEFLAYNATAKCQRRVLINYFSCAVCNLQTSLNRPFYSCVLSCLAFK